MFSKPLADRDGARTLGLTLDTGCTHWDERRAVDQWRRQPGHRSARVRRRDLRRVRPSGARDGAARYVVRLADARSVARGRTCRDPGIRWLRVRGRHGASLFVFPSFRHRRQPPNGGRCRGDDAVGGRVSRRCRRSDAAIGGGLRITGRRGRDFVPRQSFAQLDDEPAGHSRPPAGRERRPDARRERQCRGRLDGQR